MALLHSLQLRGIRRFNPDNQETIVFNQPVTLFLGQNGSGKTTIIESIRAALTGELPSGTNSGQGFLTDPKMNEKQCTKGVIRLKFTDTRGNEVTLTRIMEVKKKPQAKGLTFKNVNVTVHLRDSNDPSQVHDISGRCVDIGNYLCTALNVSKPILNNVLFCHQEDSNWPLEEPKKLKDKFDEIFDATKYNKCIEHIRKLIKDKQPDVKRFEERVEHNKFLKKEVEQRRAKFDKMKEESAKIETRINEKEDEIKPMKNRINEIIELEESLGKLQNELTAKEEQKKGIIEQQNNIKERITKFFEGSNQELSEKIDNFQEEQKKSQFRVLEMEKTKIKMQEKLTVFRNDKQIVQKKIGKHSEEQKQYNHKLEEFDCLKRKAAISLGSNLAHIKDALIVREIQKVLKNSEKDYQDLDNRLDCEEKELQAEIDKASEVCVRTRQDISSKSGLIEENVQKIRSIDDKLDRLDSSDSQLKNVEDNIEKFQTTLKKLKENYKEQEKVDEIEDYKRKIQDKEYRLNRLEKEHKILLENYIVEKNMERETVQMNEKQREISRIKNKHSENFQALFSDNVPTSSIERSVRNLHLKAEEKVKTANNEISNLQKKITKLETNIKHQEEKISEAKYEAQANQEKIMEVCDGKSFSEVLNQTYSKKETLQRNRGQFSSAQIMYKHFIEKFEKEKPCCPVCQTKFENKEQEIQRIIKQLQSKIEKIPDQLVEVNDGLKREEEFYNKLQQLKPMNDKIQILNDANIPVMEEKLSEMAQEIEVLYKDLENKKKELMKPEGTIQICKKLISDASLLDHYYSDVEKCSSNLEMFKASLVQTSWNRTRQEAEAEIDLVKNGLKTLNNQQESLKTMLDSHKDRCQTLNSNIQSEVQKKIQMEKLVQEKPLLESQREECKLKLDSLNEQVSESRFKVKELENVLANAKENKCKAVSVNKKLKEDELNKINDTKIKLKEIETLQKNIDVYVKNNIEENLNKATEESEELGKKIEEIEKNVNDINLVLDKEKKNLANTEITFTNLKDNEKLREKNSLEETISEEILKLKDRIKGNNYKTIRAEKQQLETKIYFSTREINSYKGQKMEVEKQAKDLEVELDRPEKRDAHKNFKKSFYELEITKTVIEDLKTYVNVLEKSLLQFHKERMVQINRIIKDTWRTVYKGNDIDYIQIQADEMTIGGSNRRRTYNYRVVQVSDKVELEMRGRCSAGQRVLACLVIRMALAETFSSHCGILALDEPTTNLDKENVTRLSDYLSNLITARQTQTNFQLLIITHDEEFLNTLTTGQSIEFFWKVQRDNKGFSHISKQAL